MHAPDNAASFDLSPLLTAGRTFTLRTIGGPLTLASTIAQAMAAGIPLHQIAVLAWSWRGFANLRDTCTQVLGDTLDELTYGPGPQLTGPVVQVAYANTGDIREQANHEHLKECVGEYLALIRRAYELPANEERARMRDIAAAIELACKAKLEMIELAEVFACAVQERRFRELPSFSFVFEVAQYWRDYKQQLGLMDAPDILSCELFPASECRLAVIEEAHALPPLAWPALTTLLPNASLVLAA